MNFTDAYNDTDEPIEVHDDTVTNNPTMSDYMDHIEQADMEQEISTDMLQVEGAFKNLEDVQARSEGMELALVGIENSTPEEYNVHMATIEANMASLDILMPDGMVGAENAAEYLDDAKKLATEGIGDVIKKIFSAIVSFFKKIWNFIVGLIKKIWKFITGLFGKKEEKILKECKSLTPEQSRKLADYISNKLMYLMLINKTAKDLASSDQATILVQDEYLVALNATSKRLNEDVNVFKDITTKGTVKEVFGIPLSMLGKTDDKLDISVDSKEFVTYNKVIMEPFVVLSKALTDNASPEVTPYLKKHTDHYGVEAKKHFASLGLNGKHEIYVILKNITQTAKKNNNVEVTITIGGVSTFEPSENFKIDGSEDATAYIRTIGRMVPPLQNMNIVIALPIPEVDITYKADTVNRIGEIATDLASQFEKTSKELTRIGDGVMKEIDVLDKLNPSSDPTVLYGQIGVQASTKIMGNALLKKGIKDYQMLGSKISSDYLKLAKFTADLVK